MTVLALVVGGAAALGAPAIWLARRARTAGSPASRPRRAVGLSTGVPRRAAGPHRRWRRVAPIVAVALVVSLAASMGPVLLAPGTDTLPARVAEWARQHGLGPEVTLAEGVAYQFDKPVEGGTPAAPIPAAPIPAAPIPSTPIPSATPTRGAVVGTLPSAVPPLAGTPLPNEGTWSALDTREGRTTAAVAYLRPDTTHTSFLTALVWMDQQAYAFRLHPGSQVPGGPLQAPNQLQGAERAAVWATFNSGFQMKDSGGGYWQNGVTVAPLRTGQASLVLTTDGKLSVESWPGGAPGPGIAAVRQNLALMVHGGAATPEVSNPRATVWGKTVGNAAYVWRSAIGTRADGSVVFVIGPALSVGSLARVMVAAGIQEGMELDINQDWTSFITYGQPGATPTKLTTDQVPNARRYLEPSTRDFVAVAAR